MSRDILKPINNIKTFINENDQVLWECEASAKCYNKASEKLKEDCQRLHKEIAAIEEDICEIQPQIEILSACYDVQVESLVINQESLVNERLYKKRVNEDIKKHQEEVNRIMEEYLQHYKKCKEKLEITNPAYKSLQTKRIELTKCKIRCLDMSKKLISLKNINQQKMDIRKKLFNGDIIDFAQSWVKRKQYLEATYSLNREKEKEREYMKKLVEVTEQLKQKQKEGCYRKETCFKIPQIEFSRNEQLFNFDKGISEEAKRQLNDPFSDLKKMLEKRDSTLDKAMTNKVIPRNQNTLQKIEFNASNSKIRILENKIVNPSESGKSNVVQSKEERSRAIEEKLQKVMQNFNKSISRQNSKKVVNSLLCDLKPFRNETPDILNKKCSQRTNASQESRNSVKMDVDENVQHNGSGATQDLLQLSLTNENNNSDARLSQDSNKSGSQLSKDNHYKGPINLSRQRDSIKTDPSNFLTKPANNAHNPFSQENKCLPIVAENTTNKLDRPLNNFSFNEKHKAMPATNAQPSGINQKIQNPYFGEKSQFFLSSVAESTANKLIRPLNNFSFNENHKAMTATNAQSSGINQKIQNPYFGEKSQFFLSSGFGSAFQTCSKNVAKGSTTGEINSVFKKPENMKLEIPKMTELNAAEPMEAISQSENILSKTTGENNTISTQNTPFSLDPDNGFIKNTNREMGIEGKGKIANSSTDHGNFMKMGGMLYNFGNQTQFSQNLNESYDDYDGCYMSPSFDQNYISSPPAQNTNIPMDFGNPSSFPNNCLFSFENPSKTFSFK